MTRAARLIPRRTRTWLRSHGGPLGSVIAVRTAEPTFVLTYDDGPEPGGTDAVLPVLAARGAHATFFVLMTRVRTHRQLLQDVVAAGHEIGLHGPDHRPISRMGFGEVRRRTADARAELEDTIGAPVRWFRPPYGLQSLTSFRAVHRAGLVPVVWGATAWDSRAAGDDERLERALLGAQRGAILLCHDGYAGTADGGRSNTPPTVDRGALAGRILDSYAERGLRASSLGEALATATPTRGVWFKR